MKHPLIISAMVSSGNAAPREKLEYGSGPPPSHAKHGYGGSVAGRCSNHRMLYSMVLREVFSDGTDLICPSCNQMGKSSDQHLPKELLSGGPIGKLKSAGEACTDEE